jgi:uncharacterized low-complexity protein
MANLKDIAATLAILGSGVLVMSGCGKDKPATEVPAGDAAADPAGEASCSGDKAAGEGSCSGDKAAGEGSCSAAAEGEAEPEGEAAPE